MYLGLIYLIVDLLNAITHALSTISFVWDLTSLVLPIVCWFFDCLSCFT